MTHPKHELARIEMARRLSRFVYDNRIGSDFLKMAGPRFWSDFLIPQAGEKRVPSDETKALTVELLKDLEASKAPRGPSLEEMRGARDTSSWGAPAPVPDSDGPPPTPQGSSLPAVPGPSESLATSPAFRGEGQAAPEGLDSPHPALTDKRPAVPVRHTSRSESVAETPPAGPMSPRPAGQASLLPPHQKHSETSRDAAHGIKHETARLRLAVLDILRERGPLTDEEIADALNLPQNTARPRRVELMRAGSVVKHGRKKTRSGRAANTWRIAIFRTECAWCGTVLLEGDSLKPVSHGICETCATKLENERVSA